jgi:2-polyprenyl-3-methyl-5-hydroxy-6-metoxy-1,4-benzoquinol methylase
MIFSPQWQAGSRPLLTFSGKGFRVHSHQTIVSTLQEIARRYPAEQVSSQLDDVPRMAFNIELVQQTVAPSSLCDVGGGIGIFSAACASLGIKATLIDDFGDAINSICGDRALDLHRSCGVSVVQRDVVNEGFDFPPSQFDCISCFESMEHWHGSAKRVLHGMVNSLRSGGALIISVPNCVNLRKRITVPLGRGKWSPMESWYEAPVFRGHVREPDTDDLRYIARDLGIKDVRVIGRNWVGFQSPNALIRLLTRVSDPCLRLFPSLCANIYLIGIKP